MIYGEKASWRGLWSVHPKSCEYLHPNTPSRLWRVTPAAGAESSFDVVYKTQ